MYMVSSLSRRTHLELFAMSARSTGDVSFTTSALSTLVGQCVAYLPHL
jgi:hypothetical protein